VSYEVKIVEYQAKHLAGIKVQTNMQNSTKDCSAIWAAFASSMLTINKDAKESFGVSVMLNENDFDYWAAVEVVPNQPLPDGVQCVDILPGTYLRCTVPSIEKLSDVYMYLYLVWPKSQTEYVLNQEANSFECYPSTWQANTSFDVFMPVKKP